MGEKVITFLSSILPTRAGGGGLHGLACTQLPEMYFSPGGADITALFSFPLNDPSGSHPSFVNNSLEEAWTPCLLELAMAQSEGVRGDRCSVSVLGLGAELQQPAATVAQGHKLCRIHSACDSGKCHRPPPADSRRRLHPVWRGSCLSLGVRWTRAGAGSPVEGHGAPWKPGHSGSSRSLAKTPDKAAPLELPRSAPAKQLATADFPQAKKHPKLQMSARRAQHGHVPTTTITF